MLRFAPVAALLPMTAFAAPTLESSRHDAETAFQGALIGPRFPAIEPGAAGETNFIGAPVGAILPGGSDFEKFLKEHTTLAVSPEASVQAAAAAKAELDLGSLHNRHLKARLKYVLGGKEVWVSGAFDRQQNAYVSILVDGKSPVFFNVRGLLDKEEQIEIGANKYKVWLSPNIINKMKSEIVLENLANEDEQVRVTIKKMLDAISAAGDEVKLTDQTYKAFYSDDIKDSKADPAVKTFAFILTEANGEIHVFLVPAELVPADKIASFKMFNNKQVGLQQIDGKLKVYEL